MTARQYCPPDNGIAGLSSRLTPCLEGWARLPEQIDRFSACSTTGCCGNRS